MTQESDMGQEASEWTFTQWFRKMDNQDEGDGDWLSAVEFDKTGRFLATGDRSGHIVILENKPNEDEEYDKDEDPDEKANQPKSNVHYKFHAEFPSHIPELDVVRSQSVKEKINRIKWCPMSNDALYMLVTNDQQIKLWKIHEKETYKIVNFNFENPAPRIIGNPDTAYRSAVEDLQSKYRIKTLKIPQTVRGEKAKVNSLKKKYANDVHQYNIASLSVSSDGETFLSSDHLRINLWNMSVSDQAYNIVDMKPEDMQNLSEIINTVQFHPSDPTMIYSTSMGNICVCDLRAKALVERPASVLSLTRDAGGDEGDTKGFFDEMTQNVTDARYSQSGRMIVSRDYMSVKVWDLRNNRKPWYTIYVHEFLREKMWDLYENDILWDSFGISLSRNGDIVTGSYSNYFHLYDLENMKDTFVEASKKPQWQTDIDGKALTRGRPSTPGGDDLDISGVKKKTGKFGLGNLLRKGKAKGKKETNPYNIDPANLEFDKKILECEWHPEQDLVAIAGQNNLYIYAK